MLRHPEYTRLRLAQLATKMWSLVRPEHRPLARLEVSPPVDRISWAEARALRYRPAAPGEAFGPAWSTFWFRGTAEIPDAWRGRRVDLAWDSFSEATLWLDGKIAQGLNHLPMEAEGPSRVHATLAEKAAGEPIELMVEMACNEWYGQPRPFERVFQSVSPFVLDRCRVEVFDPEAWDLYWDFKVLQELEAEQLKGLDKTWGGELLAELNRVANVYVASDRTTWTAAREILAPLLQRRNATRVHELSAVGHAHIDTAWLWPIAESKRKCERTFSSQVAYMDRYPEHRFACSQAQQLAWIEERQPDLWRRVREKIAAGQFLPVGGTWVEPDCNIPSGESLVRQFLHGQRYFKKKLGVVCTEFWNPDVFGYNGQLPQLMRLAGIDRFLTQKLSWNRFNRPAHHTFVWQGIDGSEVLAHFPPADTYNSIADPAELRRAANDYKDHDRSRHSYMLFGHGDGGGGPTPRMLETLRRATDLQGLPRARLRSPKEFFTLLEEDCKDRPTVLGELYFEYHRGTYTTHADAKEGNRRSERLLHDAELLAAIALRDAYPTEALEAAWREVLTLQFHDILPGTSIGEVYDDARRSYAAIETSVSALVDRAARAIAGEGDAWVPISTSSLARAEVATRPDGELVWVDVPPCGRGATSEATSRVEIEPSPRGGHVLVNEHLRVEVATDGSIASVVERRTGREALAGPGNVFEIYDDEPTEYDAWDVDPYHLETRRVCPPAESYEVVREGTLRAGVKVKRRVGEKSSVVQTVRLCAGARFVDFVTEVDWQESHKMLKVAFPLAVRATDATYEMQFGCVSRPTHFSTSQGLARYEVPGHRFADLGEHGFGVAILSNGKYGWSTYGGTMRLSLLRAPEWPDPNADRGRHLFSYALMPHHGTWQDARVVREAERYVSPILWTRGKAQPPCSWFEVDDPNLVLSAIKKAEDDDAIVLRLYEAHGARGRATLRSSLPLARAALVDILEERPQPVPIVDGAISLDYGPWQILTLKLG